EPSGSGSKDWARASRICALAILATCATAQAAPLTWPQYHGVPSHQGVNPLQHAVGRDNIFALSLSWIAVGVSVALGSVFHSSPTIADGLAYFGDGAGRFYAFNANQCVGQCTAVWRADLGQSIYNTPAVANGIVYVGTASFLGRLFAFPAA